MLKFQKKGKGFTLIELLIVMAIIGIMAGVVLVSMKSYAVKGRSTKVLAQVSSVIPSMISCWGNGGGVRPSGSGNICDIGPGYGTWPDMTSIGYGYAGIPGAKLNAWFFTVSNVTDGVTICCNSAMNSCGTVTVACTNSLTW